MTLQAKSQSRNVTAKKRGPGRPVVGRMDLISLKLPPELASAVAAWAQAHGLDRSAALRALIRAGLASGPAPQ